METAIQNKNYHLGLLHFVHLLVTVDGIIDMRERQAIENLKKEESIPEAICREFQNSVETLSQREIYQIGIEKLNACNDIEKLLAFVHLYRLAEADETIHIREVRFLLYSLRATRVSFEDVEYAVRLTKMEPRLNRTTGQKQVA